MYCLSYYYDRCIQFQKSQHLYAISLANNKGEKIKKKQQQHKTQFAYKTFYLYIYF